jgi:tryptophan synthase alpha chain
MPFSDPMADGPAIQLAGQRALEGRQTLNKTFDMVAPLPQGTGRRRHADLLMGYYNPIYVSAAVSASRRRRGGRRRRLSSSSTCRPRRTTSCSPATASRPRHFIRLTTPTTDDGACRRC